MAPWFGYDIVNARMCSTEIILLAMADDPDWVEIERAAAGLPDELLAPFLVIARAAQTGQPCPDDETLLRIYGTQSPGRIRRLLEHYEKGGLIVVRTDFAGRRSIGVPALGASTAPVD